MGSYACGGVVDGEKVGDGEVGDGVETWGECGGEEKAFHRISIIYRQKTLITKDTDMIDLILPDITHITLDDHSFATEARNLEKNLNYLE